GGNAYPRRRLRRRFAGGTPPQTQGPLTSRFLLSRRLQGAKGCPVLCSPPVVERRTGSSEGQNGGEESTGSHGCTVKRRRHTCLPPLPYRPAASQSAYSRTTDRGGTSSPLVTVHRSRVGSASNPAIRSRASRSSAISSGTRRYTAERHDGRASSASARSYSFCRSSRSIGSGAGSTCVMTHSRGCRDRS